VTVQSISGARSRTRDFLGGDIAIMVARRLVSLVGVLLVVSFAIFTFIHLAPGGPEHSIGGRFATPEQLAAIRESYRLDDPLLTQYGRFLSDAVRLDFGTSLSTREPVASAIWQGLIISAPLVLTSGLLVTVLGCMLGALAGRRRGGALDRAVMALTVVGASSPVFATAILLVSVFAIRLGWLPTLGAGSGLADRATHLLLPIVTLTIAGVAAVSSLVRVKVTEVLEQDYVTFARARGLSTRYVWEKAVFRNAGTQILTQVGATFIGLMAASIVVEEVFDLPGVGSLLIDAISARDIPLIQGITLLLAVTIVLSNLAVDVVCLVIDPRLRSASEVK
jgi:peptide/nickel transport system permease protein